MAGYDLDAPGTVHLIDMDGTMIAEKNNDEVVLIPQPSDNPNDPLRWSKGKKYWQYGLLFFGHLCWPSQLTSQYLYGQFGPKS